MCVCACVYVCVYVYVCVCACMYVRACVRLAVFLGWKCNQCLQFVCTSLLTQPASPSNHDQLDSGIHLV